MRTLSPLLGIPGALNVLEVNMRTTARTQAITWAARERMASWLNSCKWIERVLASFVWIVAEKIGELAKDIKFAILYLLKMKIE